MDRLFIITGASRGIGKAVTHALASSKVFNEGPMHFVLTSTKKSDLEAAQASLEQLVASQHGNISNLKVYLHPIDFSVMEHIESNLSTLFGLAQTESKWKQVILIMNHGSLGGLEFIEHVSSNLPQVCQPNCFIEFSWYRKLRGKVD